MINKQRLIENNIERLTNQIGQVANAAGFKVDIDTLTGIKSRVTTQKFYEVRPSDYMPVEVGDAAWADDILTYTSFDATGSFEAGFVETGSNKGIMEVAETGIEAVRVPTQSWAVAIKYNLMELAAASRSGNWSLIEQKERARLKNWQLGIQKVAFLGSDNGRLKGLLSQDNVTINATVIAKNISAMTPTEFQTFIQSILPAYNTNAASTAMPDTLLLPTDDFLGLGAPVDPNFPIKSKLEYLTEQMKIMTGNANFRVAPLSYSQSEFNNLGLNRYVLYRSTDAETLRMDIPVDYTTTATDTLEGFEYRSAAYGQFTGCYAYRPLEVLYFDHNVA